MIGWAGGSTFELCSFGLILPLFVLSINEFSVHRIWALRYSNVLIDVPALGILVISGIILLPILLPLSATDHELKLHSKSSTSNGTFSDLDKLSMGNVRVI